MRVVAWTMLIMNWAALRADDVMWISPVRLKLSRSCLHGWLTRTKTSGAGKKTKDAPFYVLRTAGFSGHDWLFEGFQLWGRLRNPACDFFLPQPTQDFHSARMKFMDVTQLNACMRRVLGELCTPRRSSNGRRAKRPGGRLVAEELQGFWTGHSPRHWLVSASGAELIQRRSCWKSQL